MMVLCQTEIIPPNVFVSIPVACVAWVDGRYTRATDSQISSTKHIHWNKQTLLVENVQFVCRKINKSDHDRDQKISVYSNDPCHYIFVRVDQWGFRIFIQQINQNSDFRF